jgi:hypothetical protein
MIRQIHEKYKTSKYNYTYDFSWHYTGYYHYHDSINTSMKGRIQVEMVDGEG